MVFCIFLRHFQRFPGDICQHHCGGSAKNCQADPDTPGSGAKIQHLFSGTKRQHLVYQTFCILSRDQHMGIHFKLKSHKFCIPKNVFQRDPLAAFLYHLSEFLFFPGIRLFFLMQKITASLHLKAVRQQIPGVQICLRHFPFFQPASAPL